MKRILIITLTCIAALYGCKCSNGNKKAAQQQAQEDTYIAAIQRYMAEEIGSNYAPGEFSIPFLQVVATDESNDQDIKVWGDFWVDQYNQAGDTLKCVSGGSHPGLMHVAKTADGYKVKSFDAVADGAEFIPTAKAIFEDCYDAFIALQSNDAHKKAAREQSLADYVAENQLPVKYYQDYGWDAIEIPSK